MWGVFAGLAAGLVVVVTAAPATAGTASSGRTLSYAAAAGETNRVTIVRAGDLLRVTDGGAGVMPGAGCTAVTANEVTCEGWRVAEIDVALGDGADFVSIASALDARVSGGPGNDVLEGGEGGDELLGESGDDVLKGGLGSDLLDGAEGADTLSGGTGTLDEPEFAEREEIGEIELEGDVASYADRTSPVTADSDGVADDGEAGEGDNVLTDVDVVVGGSANDVLTGNGNANVLIGGAGDDRLSGEDGFDFLAGDTGEAFEEAFETGERAGTAPPGRLPRSLGGGAAFQVSVALTRVATKARARFPRSLARGRGVSGNDTLAGGGGGVDFLLGEGGRDRLRGGSGIDGLDGGPGADLLVGGTGGGTLFGQRFSFEADFAVYARRTSVTVDLDGRADDGAAGERDAVLGDVEGLIGGLRADRLSGNRKANFVLGGPGGDRLDGRGGRDEIEGEAGADILVGGAGRDSVKAGPGRDAVFARDGTRDRVDGGPGTDEACVDEPLDRVRAVERRCATRAPGGLTGRKS